MASSQRGALLGTAPYRSRGGLITRPVSNSNEVQVQIDPMHAELDEEIYGLHRKVKQLKNAAQEIESESKYQKGFIDQLQMTLIKAQAGVKNNVRRLNMSTIQEGSNSVLHVVLFALILFFIVYFLSKIFRR
ncbi:bet1-like protein At4g14600 [Macadamia integrifolia]|uniref:bet1-like protein At4g14600 n=1 Tax=Macadamia integrifolia TaxID=60698 RepID=UPI001C4F5138|nr:bet1-like protein At4g14600 [Macadamia integrifolia]